MSSPRRLALTAVLAALPLAGCLSTESYETSDSAKAALRPPVEAGAACNPTGSQYAWAVTVFPPLGSAPFVFLGERDARFARRHLVAPVLPEAATDWLFDGGADFAHVEILDEHDLETLESTAPGEAPSVEWSQLGPPLPSCVVSFSDAFVIATDWEQPVCGARADELLQQVALQVRAAYEGLSDDEQGALCRSVPTNSGWDINDLAFAEHTLATEVQRAPEGTCGVWAAAGTVTVGGNCYFAGEVNYFLYGLISRLCWDTGDGIWLARELIRGWRTSVDFCEGGLDPLRCRAPASPDDAERHERDVAGREAWFDVGWQATSDWTAAAPPERYADFTPCSAQLSGEVSWDLGGPSRDERLGDGHWITGSFESPVEP
jgi:hypothetical protein